MYARISQDPLGLEKGVERQIKEAKDLAKQRGWHVVRVYRDNDISALRGAFRPEYAQMLEDAKSGLFDRIIAFQLSRLWRNRRERADAIELLSALRVPITLVRGADIDLTTPMGRSFAAQLGESDTLESEIKGERVAAAALERAREGKPHGHAPYGWRRVRKYSDNGRLIDWYDEIDEEQASVVRWLADEVLAGRSLALLCNELNGRGVLTSRGNAWTTGGIRNVLLRPANVGLRVHKGQVLEDVRGNWPPLLDDDKYRRLVALFNDPRRRSSVGSSKRKHLLSYGIGRCGVCGGVLRVGSRRNRTKNRDKGRYYFYTCLNPSKGCTGRSKQHLDEYVSEVVIERLRQPDARVLFVRDDSEAREAAEKAEDARARLSLVTDDYAEGLITRDQFLRLTAKLRDQLDELERLAIDRSRGVDPDLMSRLTDGDTRTVWDRLDVMQKRAVLRTLLEAVEILPSTRGPGFNPQCVRLVWRSG